MRFLLLTCCIVFINTTFCSAQVASKTNAVSFELGKTGLIYSLTLDHKLPSNNFGFRLSGGSNFAQYLNAIAVGGGGYYLVGKKTRFLELGLDLQFLGVYESSDDQKGFSLIYPDYSIKTFYPSINLGYRAYGKRSLFRIGVSPGVIDSDGIMGGYLSFGLRF